jgi:hypothetical protein
LLGVGKFVSAAKITGALQIALSLNIHCRAAGFGQSHALSVTQGVAMLGAATARSRGEGTGNVETLD